MTDNSYENTLEAIRKGGVDSEGALKIRELCMIKMASAISDLIENGGEYGYMKARKISRMIAECDDIPDKMERLARTVEICSRACIYSDNI